jgi:flagellar secretion chaperone FliS
MMKIDAGKVYQDTAARGATQIELVIFLYEAAIQDMRSALAAMQAKDIEMRCAKVSHALLILQQLQGTLDFDRGGSAARQFEAFYNLVRANLLEAQVRNSADLISQQIACMSEVRDSWCRAKQVLAAGSNQETNAAAAATQATAGGGWSA